MITDTDRIEYLEALNTKSEYTKHVVLRMSETGRGWRLHEHITGYKTVRDAIDSFMKENPILQGEDDED
jgi:hypothetical protein